MNNKFYMSLILLFLVMFIVLMCLTGCNKQIIDTTYTYNKAIINIGGETIRINIKKWKDYDGEQLQIVSTDDTVYLVSSFNAVLIKE